MEPAVNDANDKRRGSPLLGRPFQPLSVQLTVQIAQAAQEEGDILVECLHSMISCILCVLEWVVQVWMPDISALGRRSRTISPTARATKAGSRPPPRSSASGGYVGNWTEAWLGDPYTPQID